MNNTPKTSLDLKKNPNKTYIRVKVFMNSKERYAYFPTGVGVQPDEITSEKYVARTHPDHESLNKAIDDTLDRINTALQSFPPRGSKKMLKHLVNSVATTPTSTPKKNVNYGIVEVLEKMIQDSKRGVRTKPKGGYIKSTTINTYGGSLNNLKEFVETHPHLSFYNWSSGSYLEQRFAKDLADWQYDVKNHHDNTVGNTRKHIKTAINYCKNDLGLIPPMFKTDKYIKIEEDIPVEVIDATEISLLARFPLPKGLKNRESLEICRDYMIMQHQLLCRVSDLMSITKDSFVYDNKGIATHYKYYSKKTETFINVPLHKRSQDLIKKYSGLDENRVLPKYYSVRYNKEIKILFKHLTNFVKSDKGQKFIDQLSKEMGKDITVRDFTSTDVKVRSKRGKKVEVKKSDETSYNHIEKIASHTLRKSGITFLVEAGLHADEICEISGHAKGSKTIYKYIKYAKDKIDKKVTAAHDQI